MVCLEGVGVRKDVCLGTYCVPTIPLRSVDAAGMEGLLASFIGIGVDDCRTNGSYGSCSILVDDWSGGSSGTSL